jgi:hypothetical protein
MVGKIATGEIDNLTTDDGKAAAVALSRMGGAARLGQRVWQPGAARRPPRKLPKSVGKPTAWNNSRNIFLVFGRRHDMILSSFGEQGMPDRTMSETLDAVGEVLLDEFAEIVRTGHARYMSYKPEDLIELDVRAQSACTYCHMHSEADRRLIDREGIRRLEVLGGLRLWLVESANVVIRLKKMDEDGRTANYPTKQAQDYDAQRELPGLPLPPVRLTAGYWLDATQQIIQRVQICRPNGGRHAPTWCAAIVPSEERKVGERIWIDVTRQRGFRGI